MGLCRRCSQPDFSSLDNPIHTHLRQSGSSGTDPFRLLLLPKNHTAFDRALLNFNERWGKTNRRFSKLTICHRKYFLRIGKIDDKLGGLDLFAVLALISPHRLQLGFRL